jgi:hypothetical protein
VSNTKNTYNVVFAVNYYYVKVHLEKMAYYLVSKLPIDILKIIEGFNLRYDPQKHTVRYLAMTGKLSGLKYLVSKAVDIFPKNVNTLEVASRYNHLEVVEYLLQQGADIHANNGIVLREASRRGRFEIVKSIVTYEVITRRNMHSRIYQDTIEAIAHHGNWDMVKWLAGLNQHLCDYAIRAAVICSQIDILMNLITLSMDRKTRSRRLDFAVIRAASAGNLPIVKQLILHGADIHTINDTPLREASFQGHLDIVKYLVLQGVDIHANDDGALREASRNGKLEVVRYLILHGAHIHARNGDALTQAIRNNEQDVIRYLLEQGGNMSALGH